MINCDDSYQNEKVPNNFISVALAAVLTASDGQRHRSRDAKHHCRKMNLKELCETPKVKICFVPMLDKTRNKRNNYFLNGFDNNFNNFIVRSLFAYATINSEATIPIMYKVTASAAKLQTTVSLTKIEGISEQWNLLSTIRHRYC